ncbi:AGAP000279-PA [Anopheles gambiae str. PEST]|uniref:AGAP000279-PA n=1 Tax=Anopheles gambiae TaxID=7165 RepID=Q8I8Q8_ANOGA|nr:odorant-binding protein AgamOBP8 [Anopheles gambiae]EAA45127.3 AGAP000279-PA [Anopheles gambiae str. PEST]
MPSRKRLCRLLLLLLLPVDLELISQDADANVFPAYPVLRNSTPFSIFQTHGAYVVRTFADATAYRDECVQQYAGRGSSLIDYMRQVALHTDNADSRWCIVRCILQKADLLDGEGAPHEANVHAQMQHSNAIVEDPDDIRSETSRCLREPPAPDSGGGCLRAYTFFACIQSTEYDLF